MAPETITINFSYYQELVEAQQFLLFLEGVVWDDWEDYDTAFEYWQSKISK